MRYWTALLLTVVSIALLTATRNIAQAAPEGDLHSDVRSAHASPSESTSEFVRQVIVLTNRERLKAGLPALKRERRLEESADWLAHDMALHNYFDHRDSGQRDMPARLGDFKYRGYHAIGENIATGQHTPQEVVSGWMSSPGHRANILSEQFAEIGVAYAPPSERNRSGYWVQDFGSRFDACPLVINDDCDSTLSARVTVSIHGGEWAEQMRFSNDGTNWTGWERFESVRNWELLPGVGRRTVFAEVRRPGRTERLEAAVRVDETAAQSARNMPGKSM